MRDKLIELLYEAEGQVNNDLTPLEMVADYLIAHGVIVPPCKIGDDVYWIDTEEETVQCAKKDIKAIVYCGNDRFQVITGGMVEPEDIHTDWCMLSEEEANKRLLERNKT